MPAKKELTSQEYNDKIFAEIQKLEDKIKELRDDLKPIEAVPNLSIAECNAMTRKHAKQRAEAAAKKAK